MKFKMIALLCLLMVSCKPRSSDNESKSIKTFDNFDDLIQTGEDKLIGKYFTFADTPVIILASEIEDIFLRQSEKWQTLIKNEAEVVANQDNIVKLLKEKEILKEDLTNTSSGQEPLIAAIQKKISVIDEEVTTLVNRNKEIQPTAEFEGDSNQGTLNNSTSNAPHNKVKTLLTMASSKAIYNRSDLLDVGFTSDEIQGVNDLLPELEKNFFIRNTVNMRSDNFYLRNYSKNYALEPCSRSFDKDIVRIIVEKKADLLGEKFKQGNSLFVVAKIKFDDKYSFATNKMVYFYDKEKDIRIILPNLKLKNIGKDDIHIETLFIDNAKTTIEKVSGYDLTRSKLTVGNSLEGFDIELHQDGIVSDSHLGSSTYDLNLCYLGSVEFENISELFNIISKNKKDYSE